MTRPNRELSSLPTYIYAVEGQESNVYYDNVFTDFPKSNWWWDVVCVRGQQYTDRWSYTPTAAHVGTAAWSITPIVGSTTFDAETATLRISALTNGDGLSRNVMVLGDSTGYPPLAELQNLFDGDDMTVTLVGQRLSMANDSDDEQRNSYHESIDSWSWDMMQSTQVSEYYGTSQLSDWKFTGHVTANTSNQGYVYYKLSDVEGTRTVSVYKDSAGTELVAQGTSVGDGTVTLTAQNASGLSGTVVVAYTEDDTDAATNLLKLNFLVRDADVGIDVDQYLTDTSTTLSEDDWVIINLGINDIDELTTDAAVVTELANIASNIEAIVGTGDTPADTTFRGAVSGIRIGICVPIPPAATQDACGDDYNSGKNIWRLRRNMKMLQNWIIDTYDTAAYIAKDIHVVPLHINMDTVHNCITTETAYNARNPTTYLMQTDTWHPETYGYWQMADTLFAFLKWFE